MKHHLFTLLMALAASGASAQNTIWFDQPTSLKGRACWYGGHPERFDAQHKPVRAGDAAVNSDHEWEYRSLPLGNGSIGCNVMGSISTERYTLNEKTLWRGGPNTAKGAADYWNQNKQSAHVLKDIRQAFTDGDWNKAAQLTAQNFNSPVPYEATGEPQFRFGSFTTMGELCIDTETTDTDPMRATLVGMSFAISEGEAWYVPVGNDPCGVAGAFKAVLENPATLKIGQNMKYDLQVLRSCGIRLAGPMFDTMIAHYLLHPEMRHGMDYLAEAYLNYQTIHIEELIGTGKRQRSSAEQQRCAHRHTGTGGDLGSLHPADAADGAGDTRDGWHAVQCLQPPTGGRGAL